MVRFIIFLSLNLAVRLSLFYSQDHNFSDSQPRFDRGQKSHLPIISEAKDKIISTFNKGLPNEESALLLGIVYGEKGSFDRDYFEAMRRTGVLHVIAASGMNVTMTAGVIFAVLAFLVKRTYALVFASFAILIYTALANFEESIVRASIMAILAYSAGLLGRQNTSLLALFIAIFLMVFYDPGILEKIGFQLSVAATAGIILFDPIFKKLFRSIFFEDFRTTLSAQIATVPILLFYFSTYSPISVIANLLILWTVPPIMILGILASILSLFTQVLAAPLLWLALPLLLYFKWIVLFLNKYAFELETQNLPIALTLGYYFIVLAAILWIYKKWGIRV
ncbi:MAG: ComEC/Rec2 family competence protein [Candidatus Levybacteria bacterium]|nr:ComEC/Rec2 family competence protein [Candidatus Levybacteria bacterium]